MRPLFVWVVKYEFVQQKGCFGLKIQYISVPNGAAVLSCEGAGSVVSIPECVDGLPVREICAYAFSAPAAARRLPPKAEIRSARVSAPVPGIGETFLGGASLREVQLPPGVQVIGEYAFYNCTALERLCLSAGAARIGNGAFMNCGALKEIRFFASPDEQTCLPGLLTETQQEVRVEFHGGGETAVWIFPEYFEESVENAPAHIFEHFIHGAGYRYRQCFQGNRVDAVNYDQQFPMAKIEAEPAAALRIALERLRHPFHLSEAAEKQYRSHLTENAVAAAGLLITDDDPEGLVFLAENGILTRESIGAAAEEAARKERAECLSVLLNEQHARFAPKEKVFDL
ncbi:hypothetical protein CAGA_08010 [Caproiciproducens galactitolivorans]|uniref:Leucine-rich repeat domain-containing protein n=1 Tax=Caproiciproducens galactitolivorans TaxID=642589 RepID=A0A4Z0YDZ8_9FIRM|nr:hypothetical protein CAGA_08010 [Caproiciproducens galactitolivorans]